MPVSLPADANPCGLANDALDREYNARASVPDWLVYLQAYQKDSARARATLPCVTGVPYGEHPDETLDIFPASHANAPVFVYIHGGYWRALSKDDSAFMAPALHQAGATVVIVNYALAPAVSVETIVTQCRRAVAWVYQNIHRHNGNPARIHCSGSSAGGHLVGMLLAPGWHAGYQVPESVVHSASTFSGLFDLRPLVDTHINEWTQFTPESARALSPRFHLPVRPCAVVVACGALESGEFRRQSAEYAQALMRADARVYALEVAGTNHFSVVQELANPASAVSQRIYRVMGL